MRCYCNIKNGEIKTLIDFDDWESADEKLWDEEAKEIEENWSDYIEFTGFESHESYRIMEDFAESIDNEELRHQLINALNRPKLFRNFKERIDNSGDYRQHWFEYKKKCFIEHVREQIKARE